MSSVVSLRLARKRKARAEKERMAEENRALHGRTRAEKLSERRQSEKSAAFVDGHRLDPKGRDGAS